MKSEEVTEQKGLIPVATFELTDELRAKARRELFEVEETKEQSIILLRNLLKEEKDLDIDEDKDFLLKFLRARKFNIQRASVMCKKFYRAQYDYPELYDPFDYSSVRRTMDAKIGAYLQYRDTDGCVVILVQAGKWNVGEVPVQDIFRTLTAGLIQSISYPPTQISGYKVIFDLKGFGLKHLTSIPLRYVWLLAHAVQDAFPGRFKGIHFVNENGIWTFVWNLVRRILKVKTIQRFHFHGKNVRSLHEFFPKSILPEEYEGDMGLFDVTYCKQHMLRDEAEVLEAFKHGYKKRR